MTTVPSQVPPEAPKKIPTARQQYIKFLEMAAEENEELLIAELIESKHLKGAVRSTPEGGVAAARFDGITMEGRLFLQKLKKEESDESFSGRSKRYGLILLGVVGALLIDVVKDVAVKILE